MSKKVIVKISNLAKSHDLTFEQLSEITGVRAAALNELANGKRQRIQFDHIQRIAEALNITDIREIIDLEEEA
jgi:transcriptional regulator with XRE-family HTH domain